MEGNYELIGAGLLRLGECSVLGLLLGSGCDMFIGMCEDVFSLTGRARHASLGISASWR